MCVLRQVLAIFVTLEGMRDEDLVRDIDIEQFTTTSARYEEAGRTLTAFQGKEAGEVSLV